MKLTENLITALYCRLFQENMLQGECNSIKNQKLMLQKLKEMTAFAREQPKEFYAMATQNVVLMCKKLGSSCIAEGVETPEQIAALKSINCNLAQGYYYNKPIPSNEFTKKYIALNDTEKKD